MKPSSSTPPAPLDPRLDLGFERLVDLPASLIWRAWTEPELIKQWFCPLPWTTVGCELDLRLGGIFHTTMRSPEGEEFPNLGCFLEIIHERQLTWTNALLANFRPNLAPALPGPDDSAFSFTATIILETQTAGTLYKALVRHGRETDRQKHEAMGFREGWGIALDQLVALMKRAS
jgi:uncharacterized protein YndB with AHSA1/START domain